jgi:ergothioneine biosynthesis protein EgtB
MNLSRQPPDSARLIARYQQVRTVSETLCSALEIEDYGIQAMADVSPPKWHLAHTTWFFETFILQAFQTDYRVFHRQYAILFNSYYESAGSFFPRAERGCLSRPTVAEIYQYRKQVDEAMLNLLQHPPIPDAAEIYQRAQLGLEHEMQHQELLLMDIKYNFFINPLQPAYRRLPEPANRAVSTADWQYFPGGVSQIGYAGCEFCFDNEQPSHPQLLQAYRLQNRLVNNGEFLNFIEDGGYRRAELWLSDGWRIVNNRRWQAPLYWQTSDSGWLQFSLGGLRELIAEEPVAHLSYYEADAYARWAGKRLPSEAEWECAVAGLAVSGNFLESGILQPCPADGDHMQFYGDVWEWTQSPYLPYPGFKPLAGSLGEYNGKFMCNQMVLRGGCCLTPASHIRASYRNFFRPEDRWQCAGFRLAEDT